METSTFLSTNGRDTIARYHYPAGENPTYVVQIIHGMSEYLGRYAPLAEYLNGQGIAVVGHDHMSHGGSVYSQRGEFKDTKQAQFMEKDAHKMTHWAHDLYPNAKVIIFCHSMGSFIGRLLVERHPTSMDGIIICGTSGKNPLAAIGKYIALILAAVRGGEHRSNLIDKLSFGAYNNKYPQVQTKFDWLSTDPSQVQKYVDDPDCGFLFSVNGSVALTDLLMEANGQSAFDAARHNLPILLIAGTEDPVGNYGQGVLEVAARYKAAGCTSVGSKLYQGARHEILLDFTGAEVMEDVLHFVQAI